MSFLLMSSAPSVHRELLPGIAAGYHHWALMGTLSLAGAVPLRGFPTASSSPSRAHRSSSEQASLFTPPAVLSLCTG